MATVAVCGTGWMGRALGDSIASASTSPAVVFGSRFPEASKGFKLAWAVVSIEDAINASSSGIVVLAMPASAHAQFAEQYGHLLTGKVVVDISNAPSSPSSSPSGSKGQSVAETLQALLPGAHVVKAFNNLSAYELADKVDRGVPKVVRICGDNRDAVAAVRDLVQDMGMTPAVVGTLKAAGQLEASQHELFTAWHVPGIIVKVFFVFNFIYALIWYVYLDPVKPPYEPPEKIKQLPAKVMNVIVANTAVLTLSATFLPGSVASIWQLVRWDAVSAFPRWLNGWLSARKELGLISFWFVIMHAILVTIQMSPDAYYSMYDFDPVTKEFGDFSNYGEVVVMLGVLDFSLLIILAVNSLPSVGAMLSYAEWRFVFSWLGHLILAIAFIHELLYSLTHWNCDVCGKDEDGHPVKLGSGWPETPSGTKIPPPTWITIGVTGLTLLLHIVLTLPPFSLMLRHLRTHGAPRHATRGTPTPAPRPSHNGYQNDPHCVNVLASLRQAKAFPVVTHPDDKTCPDGHDDRACADDPEAQWRCQAGQEGQEEDPRHHYQDDEGCCPGHQETHHVTVRSFTGHSVDDITVSDRPSVSDRPTV